MVQADAEFLAQTTLHMPWMQLLGEEETQDPANNEVCITGREIEAVRVEGNWVPATDPAAVVTVGSVVRLNTDPENWHGADGGCQRVTYWLHGKEATITQLGW